MTPTKTQREGEKKGGTQDCPSNPSSYFLFLFLLPSPTASFSALHVCQAFIKQLEEGVSFPWSSCQLFPISPAPWKSLQTPLSLSRPGAEPEPGAGAGVRGPCAPRLGLCLRAWIQSPRFDRQQPKALFGIFFALLHVNLLRVITRIESESVGGASDLKSVWQRASALGQGLSLDGEQRWQLP